MNPLHDLIAVEYSQETPSFVVAQRARGAKRQGLLYEGRVQPRITELCKQSPKAVEYLPSPWFKYRIAAHPFRENFAQPDGLIINMNEGLVYVVEIKLRHTVDAYFQLLDRYIPLMQKFFPKDFRFCAVEVCRWFDPMMAFPTKITLREVLLEARPNEFCVHRMRIDD